MAIDYKVTSQKLDTAINPDGTGFSTHHVVRYKVTSGPAEGTTGEIHVKPENLTGAHVKAALDTIVAKHQEVADI
jgi:hypothetical protein